MFLLDSNVLSDLMLPRPPTALAAFKAQSGNARMVTTSICVAEILAGIGVLPSSRRRANLERAARFLFERIMAGGILPFDEAAAQHYADIFCRKRRLGRPAPVLDLMIAAVAAAHGATVVTRNVGNFEDCGVAVLNPWA